MTVPLTAAKNNFLGNGSTTIYQTTIYAKDASYIHVYVNELESFTHSLTQFNDAAGVKVTFTTAPVSGAAIRVSRVLPLTQAVVIQNNSGYLAKSTENLADDAMMIAQQLFAAVEEPALSVAIAATALEFSRVQSIAGLKALLKTNLIDGLAYRVDGYIAGYTLGGGLFVWSAASTTAANNVLVFTANEGGTGRWLRKHPGYLTPWDGGAVSGALVNQSTIFTAVMAVVNTDTTVLAFDLAGLWRLNAGILDLTRDGVVLTSSGFCQLTRLNNGLMIQLHGNDCRAEFITCKDDIVLPVPPSNPDYDAQRVGDYFTVWGNNGIVQTCGTYGGSGKGFHADEISKYARFLSCTAIYSGSAGFGMGKAYAPLALACMSLQSKAEGFQADEMTWARIIACYSIDSGGIGNYAGNDVVGGLLALNFAKGGSNGYAIGQKGIKGSKNLGVISNLGIQSNGYSVRLRNYTRTCAPTAITKASPAVATFARINITGVTQANPCVVTAPAHGLLTDDKRRINGVLGMTQLNGNIYRIRYLTANTFGLLGLEDDIPLDTTTFTAYSSSGFLDHAFEADKGQIIFTGVTGMTQINDLVLRPSAAVGGVTATTVTFTNDDGTNLDSAAFGVFVAGGIASSGEGTSKSSIIGNLSKGNVLGSMSIGGRDNTAGQSNNVIIGNSSEEVTSYFGSQASSQVINRQVWFSAVLAADVNNITGNGTFYDPQMGVIDDTATCYAPGTGKFTAPYAGFYEFEAGMDIGGAGGATAANVYLRVEDPYNVATVSTFPMVPDGALPASPTWSGRIRLRSRLEKGAVVYCRLKVSGLGLVVNIKAGSFFNGRAVG